jgi:hypothetical protein
MKITRKELRKLIKESRVTLSNYNQFLSGVSQAFAPDGALGKYDLENYFVGAGHMTAPEFAYDIMNSGLKYRSSLTSTAFSFELNAQDMKNYLKLAFQADRSGGISGTHRSAAAAVIFCIPKDADLLSGMMWHEKFDNDSMIAYNDAVADRYIQTVPPQLVLCVVDLDKGIVKPNPLFFQSLNVMKHLISNSITSDEPLNIYDDIATLK